MKYPSFAPAPSLIVAEVIRVEHAARWGWLAEPECQGRRPFIIERHERKLPGDARGLRRIDDCLAQRALVAEAAENCVLAQQRLVTLALNGHVADRRRERD